MRLRQLTISNFRGIKELDWKIPDTNVVCLIGRGDSNKSTVLEAIQYVFHPYWNASLTDNDFYNCDTTNSVCITAVLGDLDDSFKSRFSTGDYLSGWNPTTKEFSEEPKDDDGWESALRVRFTVKENLESVWEIARNDTDEGVPFKPKTRESVGVSLIGHDRELHLSWGHHSILNRLTKQENLNSSLAIAARSAKNALDQIRGDISELDVTAGKAQTIAESLGIRVKNSYKAQLDISAIQVRRGGVAMHDGDVPLKQLGLGSRRMLISALQKSVIQGSHITLFDEIEIGLEPDRIARLLTALQKDNVGQFFVTTHSPVVLRELDISQLFIAHSSSNKTEIIEAAKDNIKDSLQGRIRAAAESFLAKKIIVCEGKTEQFFLRGMDDGWIGRDKLPFSYEGVTLYNAKGANNIRGIAEDLHSLGYKVAVFADSDSPDNFSDDDATALRGLGIEVVLWNDNLSIEQRVFKDVQWEAVIDSLKMLEENGIEDIPTKLTSSGAGALSSDFEWTESDNLREKIGDLSKSKDWFKDYKGVKWANLLFPYIEGLPETTDLKAKLNKIRTWIDGE